MTYPFYSHGSTAHVNFHLSKHTSSLFLILFPLFSTLIYQDLTKMPSGSTTPDMSRFPKLKKPTEYIPWKRRIFAMNLYRDPLQTCFEDKPAGNYSQSILTNWISESEKEKATIILGLGDSAQTKTISINDDPNGTSKDL